MTRNPRARSRLPRPALVLALAAGALGPFLSACGDPTGPVAPRSGSAALAPAGPPAPPGLVTLSLAGGDRTFWPYTGAALPAAGEALPGQDPVDLVLLGDADPRDVRSALLGLDGDRSAFGPLAAFDCTWSDAFGDVQTAYAEPDGWTAGVVQLQCGEYGPVRFHLRLFRFAGLTLGAAHFEVQIPGTTEHQVLSWELAEGLVVADLSRTGLLGAPPATTGALNDAPSFRTIPTAVYDGLPPELKAVTGGPAGDAASDVPIPTDGQASVLLLADRAEPAVGARSAEFTVDFDQAIPRPFCSSGPADFVYARGPVHFTQRVSLGPDGVFVVHEEARGRLSLIPIDPATGTPVGPEHEAEVRDTHDGRLTDGVTEAGARIFRAEIPPTGPERGHFESRLHVGPGGSSGYSRTERCEP